MFTWEKPEVNKAGPKQGSRALEEKKPRVSGTCPPCHTNCVGQSWEEPALPSALQSAWTTRRTEKHRPGVRPHPQGRGQQAEWYSAEAGPGSARAAHSNLPLHINYREEAGGQLASRLAQPLSSTRKHFM